MKILNNIIIIRTLSKSETELVYKNNRYLLINFWLSDMLGDL